MPSLDHIGSTSARRVRFKSCDPFESTPLYPRQLARRAVASTGSKSRAGFSPADRALAFWGSASARPSITS